MQKKKKMLCPKAVLVTKTGGQEVGSKMVALAGKLGQVAPTHGWHPIRGTFGSLWAQGRPILCHQDLQSLKCGHESAGPWAVQRSHVHSEDCRWSTCPRIFGIFQETPRCMVAGCLRLSSSLLSFLLQDGLGAMINPKVASLHFCLAKFFPSFWVGQVNFGMFLPWTRHLKFLPALCKVLIRMLIVIECLKSPFGSLPFFLS